MTEHLTATPSSSNNPSTLPPVIRPGERFTRVEQALFLEYLAEWGNVRAAAKAAGVSRQHAYRVRRACPEFALAWDAARLAALPRVEDVLADRALNGVEEQVFYHGEEVAVRRRYDARLLLAHMSRLDRLTGDAAVREASRNFDAQLEALEGLPEIEWVLVPVDDAPEAGDERDDDGAEGVAEDGGEDRGEHRVEGGAEHRVEGGAEHRAERGVECAAEHAGEDGAESGVECAAEHAGEDGAERRVECAAEHGAEHGAKDEAQALPEGQVEALPEDPGERGLAELDDREEALDGEGWFSD